MLYSSIPIPIYLLASVCISCILFSFIWMVSLILPSIKKLIVLKQKIRHQSVSKLQYEAFGYYLKVTLAQLEQLSDSEIASASGMYINKSGELSGIKSKNKTVL